MDNYASLLGMLIKIGDYDAARGIFDAMPNQNIVAWNPLTSTYEQCGKPNQALKLFQELQLSKTAKPDGVTLVSTLSACAHLGAMDLG